MILGVWIAAWATGLTGRFTFESIRASLAGNGPWGIVAFVLLFVAGQLLRVPSPVFVAAGVAVYGLKVGVLIGLLGALTSATVSFSVVRMLTGQALADTRLPLVSRLLNAIDDRPIMTVALLRLIFQTAPPLNAALAMTGLRWRDHLIGSLVGLPFPITVMASFFEWLLRRAAEQ